MTPPAHPPYQLLPTLAEDDLAQLRADIAARGVQVPIEVDEDGNILDGHHRKRIADELGIDCPTIVRSGLSEADKRVHAGMLNLARRQLTDGQKVYLGRLLEPDITQAARERMGEGGRKGIPGKGGASAPPFLQPTKKRVRDEVADRVGLGSGFTYERGRKVLDWADRDAPELVAEVAEGRASIADVNTALKRRAADDDQRRSQEALDHVLADADDSVLTTLRRHQRLGELTAARAAVRRHLAALDTGDIAALSDDLDRIEWNQLAGELRRWADQLDQAFAPTGLRRVK